jgi:hypothetical protein
LRLKKGKPPVQSSLRLDCILSQRFGPPIVRSVSAGARSVLLPASADEPVRGMPSMQVTVTVSDAIVREAGVRGLTVIDFVESLIDRGMGASHERPVLDSAMERIRALRSAKTASSR